MPWAVTRRSEKLFGLLGTDRGWKVVRRGGPARAAPTNFLVRGQLCPGRSADQPPAARSALQLHGPGHRDGTADQDRIHPLHAILDVAPLLAQT